MTLAGDVKRVGNHCAFTFCDESQGSSGGYRGTATFWYSWQYSRDHFIEQGDNNNCSTHAFR
jgi:hypothetical protein